MERRISAIGPFLGRVRFSGWYKFFIREGDLLGFSGSRKASGTWVAKLWFFPRKPALFASKWPFKGGPRIAPGKIPLFFSKQPRLDFPLSTRQTGIGDWPGWPKTPGYREDQVTLEATGTATGVCFSNGEAQGCTSALRLRRYTGLVFFGKPLDGSDTSGISRGANLPSDPMYCFLRPKPPSLKIHPRHMSD